jgi:3-oxoacyl-[acyl-carrier-protein] synthase II
VVTGLGCVTPVGQTVASFWRALLAGKSGAQAVEGFDTSPYRTHIGCEVKEFVTEPGTLVASSRPGWKAFGRATKLALVAASQAIEQSGIEPGALAEGLGISLGTTMGEPCFLDQLAGSGKEAAAPAAGQGHAAERWEEILSRNTWSIAANVARELGIQGVQASLPAACSAGNYAVGLAFDLIRQGQIRAAVAGGTEAFSESAFAGFSRLNALATQKCQPFDRDRQGLLLGEGAGVMVLEAEEHALSRGATILGRVLGYGLSCDAYHITGPHPDGEGAAACMRNALADARVSREEVGYICCHGTGTRQNDRIEALAIQRVFGSGAKSLPVSSIKALTGHMMGAASAVEAIACVLALYHGVLPPTWNYEHRDPECDLDVIPNEPRQREVKVLLNNSYAFGGNNACVALARA